MEVVTYVRELASRHGIALGPRAEQAWRRFEERLTSNFWWTAARRVLRLEPRARDWIANSEFEAFHVDVALRGVDGRSELYELAEVTGVDERVQAVVASQEATATCLLLALERVEVDDLHVFSFVCQGATHRSVACCFLFAALAHPKAEILLTTARTRDAAAKAASRRPSPRSCPDRFGRPPFAARATKRARPRPPSSRRAGRPERVPGARGAPAAPRR
jgi:hypothetical protein